MCFDRSEYGYRYTLDFDNELIIFANGEEFFLTQKDLEEMLKAIREAKEGTKDAP